MTYVEQKDEVIEILMDEAATGIPKHRTIIVSFRASRAPAWLGCPRRAGAEERTPENTTPQLGKPVAMEFGDTLHRLVTGHEIRRRPRSIAFDEHTRTFKEFERQIVAAYREVREFLDVGEIVGKELPLESKYRVEMSPDFTVQVNTSCHIDLVWRSPSGLLVNMDLKTSRVQPRVAWSQLAINATLYEEAHGRAPDQVGVLWSPRGQISKAEPIFRDGREAAQEGKIIIKGRAAAAVVEEPRPSREGCATCKVENCAVRA